MVIDRETLREQLKRREFAPVYVLFGTETYLRDLAAKTIADLSFAPGDLRDFSESKFSLENDGNLERALATAEQLPMLANKRVVEIKDVRVSASGYRDTIGEDDLPLLERYFADPSPRSIVIFIADELNGVRKAGKFLRDKALAVEFKPLTDQQLAEWARKEFASAGASIDDLSLKYFLLRIEKDVLRMTNEVKKLSTAAQPEGVVTSDLVDSIVANARTLTNFELTDHLVAGRSRQAISTLRKILDDGAEPVALLGLLSYNYRRLLMAKDMMDRGADRREVANVLQLRYSDQESFLAAARRASTATLSRAIKLLSDTDLAIKTSLGGSDSSRLQIEMLVCQLTLP